MNKIEPNNIYNENCLSTMKTMVENNFLVDLILTSPPYNMTSRRGGESDTGRYDVYEDWMSEKEYLDFTVSLFDDFNHVLRKNRVVLYNFSYSIENPSLPYKLVSEIEKRTNWVLIDTIVWKKKCGLPFPANSKRLSRNWEFVWVFVREDEKETYENNRKIISISEKTGQNYYDVVYNFVESENNDGKCPYNQATYSSDFCKQLMNIYCKEGWTVYDPFMGSGTTAVASVRHNCNYIGSELSESQIEFANNRIKRELDNNINNLESLF